MIELFSGTIAQDNLCVLHIDLGVYIQRRNSLFLSLDVCISLSLSLSLFLLICSTFSSNCHFSSYSHLLLLGLKMSITQVPEFCVCMCVGKMSCFHLVSTQTCGDVADVSCFCFKVMLVYEKAFASLWFYISTWFVQLHLFLFLYEVTPLTEIWRKDVLCFII